MTFLLVVTTSSGLAGAGGGGAGARGRWGMDPLPKTSPSEGNLSVFGKLLKIMAMGFSAMISQRPDGHAAVEVVTKFPSFFRPISHCGALV